MIGIIDYGMGNLRSVENALHKLKVDCVITSQKEVLDQCQKWILLGVGAFPDCISNLKKMDLFDYIKDSVNNGKPLLGICLGMQALFEYSTEMEYCQGFGFIKGNIQLMEDLNVRIPHIGWNQLEKNQDHDIYSILGHEPYVYFVHSDVSFILKKVQKMD